MNTYLLIFTAFVATTTSFASVPRLGWRSLGQRSNVDRSWLPTNMNHKQSKGCSKDGHHYKPGGAISQSDYDPATNTCTEVRCSPRGNIITRTRHNCRMVIQKTTTTTAAPDTTPPDGCFQDGEYFVPGDTIYDVTYDESSNTCHGSYCGDDGRVVSWDDFRCKSTILPPQTPTPTTPDYTTPPGCYGDNGDLFAPGQTMSETYEESSNWCYGSYCDQQGQVIPWDKWDCKSTTVSPTTTTQTTPPRLQLGCYGDNGKLFNPGEKMNEGYDETTNWCFGSFCNQHGMKVEWDKWDCKPTTPHPTPTETTTPTPTTFPTTVPGCYDDAGTLFPPGQNMNEGYDGSSNHCYGSYCDEHGMKVHWDTWDCKSTTSFPTTTESI